MCGSCPYYADGRSSLRKIRPPGIRFHPCSAGVDPKKKSRLKKNTSTSVLKNEITNRKPLNQIRFESKDFAGLLLFRPSRSVLAVCSPIQVGGVVLQFK